MEAELEELEVLEKLKKRYGWADDDKDFLARKKHIMKKYNKLSKVSAKKKIAASDASEPKARMMFKGWHNIGNIGVGIGIASSMVLDNIKRGITAKIFDKFAWAFDYDCARSGNTTIAGEKVKFRRITGVPRNESTLTEMGIINGQKLYLRGIEVPGTTNIQYQWGELADDDAEPEEEGEEEEGEEEPPEEEDEEEEEEPFVPQVPAVPLPPKHAKKPKGAKDKKDKTKEGYAVRSAAQKKKAEEPPPSAQPPKKRHKASQQADSVAAGRGTRRGAANK